MIKILEKLKKGGLIIFPTDTVYGIGSLPIKSSLDKIYDIKKRDKEKKIVALISNKDIINKLIEKNELVNKIVDKYFPGELTLISKSSKYIKDLLNYEYIGFRMPNNKVCLELIEKSGGLIMTTSANISGEKSPNKFKDISKNILSKVDGYIENDENLSGIASSIYMIKNDEIIEIRKGNINLKEE